MDFEKEYGRLNTAQKRAVDQTEGPVLVIAGPGTGKTQLLSLRIANILKKTDTLPENILCLTFTDSAAANMRERLTGIIGKAAYDVTISTYHAFGSELLRRYPEYFTDSADLRPADDLTIDAIFRDIQAGLPYSNPLKFDTFIRDVKQLVSDSKRALMTPGDIRELTSSNQSFIAATTKHVQKHFDGMVRIDKNALARFSALEAATESLVGSASDDTIVPLAHLWQESLQAAIIEAEQSGKTTSLTKWKNQWLAKDENGGWIADGAEQNRRVSAGADIYERYEKALKRRGLYDYNDMILRAIKGLEAHNDFRFTLQERYLYLLLDEYQDTNEAQAKMVELLTDNPINEGRPNVLAVGDDDQAIYAFQGANYSHMLNFFEHYKDVLLVPLTENYRSHADVLNVAEGISSQIETRLHHNFPAIDKTITAANKSLPQKAVIERHEFKSPLSQNTWVTAQIQRLLKQGIAAHDIAVLAPKHEFLESLVPYMQRAQVPIHYEKRDNVLDEPAIQELILMSKLVLALASQNQALASSYWPEVLSLPFWELPTSRLWELSWEANDTHKPWTNVLCDQAATRPIALFFIRLSQLVGAEPLEHMLDLLIGVSPLALQEEDIESYRSPFYAHYFELIDGEREDTQSFWQLLSNLTVLRERLREYRTDELSGLLLAQFVEFIDAHRAAQLKILNTNPYQEAAEAVELSTTYKAKGQEYEAVFLLGAIDEVWGTKARALGSRLALPPNLQFIRYAGTTEDERLRLLYVALTRAKTQLYMTSYTNNYSGKAMTRLKYLDERSTGDGFISPLLPPASQLVRTEDTAVPDIADLTVYWQTPHYQAISQPSLKSLLQPRLDAFQLSPTQLNTFLNVRSAGPPTFFLQALLRFPSAPSISAEYGNTMHETLEWVHIQNKEQGKLPTLPATLEVFKRRLQARRLGEQQTTVLTDRGRDALRAYLQQRADTLSKDNYAEYNFRNENVFIGEAHLSGKIDKLIVNKRDKTIVIVDFKTGRSHVRWEREAKLHFYRYQLYFYKLLVENSRSFRGYKVIDAYLEFVDPDTSGRIQELHTTFDDELSAHLQRLIERIWQCTKALDFPDITSYSADLKGIEAFEADLLAE